MLAAGALLLPLLNCAPTTHRSAIAPEPEASDTTARRERAQRPFYVPHPYGTDAQFNPVTIVVNEGFDQLRTSPRYDITTLPFGASFHGVLRTVIHPDRGIRRYGVSNWLRDEIFPLTTRAGGGGQWYPNYTLHLFGAGVTYRRLTDWFALHGIEEHPQLAAGVTTYAFHFLNEAVENGPHADDGVDALSDLLVFDAASIVLWNQGFMKRWFTGPLEVNTWPGQASLGVPGRTVENAYSLVMLRAPLPRTDDWKAIVTHGNMFVFGLSRRVAANDWLSLGLGADAPANPVIDSTTGRKTADLRRNGGLFYDRNGSLLVSLVAQGGSNNGVTLNIYPGVIGVGSLKPGLWVQQNRGGGYRFGISSGFGLGLSSQAGVKE